MLKSLLVLAIACATTLHAEVKVLAFSGSTRDGSLNAKLIAQAADIAKTMHAHITVIDLNDFPMPFYDADLEASEGMPAKVKAFRSLMIQNDVIFIASPEYNGSLSAVLKNAIDWASRSESKEPSRDAFKNKKILLLSATPGSGGNRGLAHLRDILTNIGGIVLPQQLVVTNSYNAFDANGHLKDAKTQADLQAAVKAALM